MKWKLGFALDTFIFYFVCRFVIPILYCKLLLFLMILFVADLIFSYTDEAFLKEQKFCCEYIFLNMFLLSFFLVFAVTLTNIRTCQNAANQGLTHVSPDNK